MKSRDTVFTTSSSPLISLTTSVSVNTNQGSSIESVTCTLIDPNNATVGQFSMADNGSSGDTTSNDGVYTAVINVNNIGCLVVGNYKLQYLAENASGLFSNLIESDLRVVNTANLPPVIISTNLPDSVVRPASGSPPFTLTISINVNDPDGLCDLKDAFFVTTRPNGDTIVPIPMTYNGNGEFVFSNSVSYSPDPTSYGYFKYKFTARDNSNVSSVPVLDSINFVYP